MSLLIIVDSEDRITGSSSNFIYQPKYVDQPNVKKFKINKISVPFSFYTTKTHQFIYNMNGTNYTITFEGGFYSATSLASTLQTTLNSYTAPFTTNVVYNSIKNVFEFTPSIGTSYFNFTGFITHDNFHYSIAYQAGLISKIGETMSPSAFYLSKYAVNTTATSSIYLKSSTLSMYYTSFFRGEKNSVLTSIPISVNPLNWIVYQSSVDVWFNYDGQTINNIDIQIVDDNDILIDLRGLDIIIEIEFQI